MQNSSKVKQQTQRGMVSLFTVLFTTLLLTVMTVGFVRLMLQEQRQAQNQDLAQSAYDSAMSGVEDAKRVLRSCVQNPASSACVAIKANKCDTIPAAGIAGAVQSETTIKSGNSSNPASDLKLNQAYTCVKIALETDDYLGDLYENSPKIVPLRATGNFNRIVIQWMHKSGSATGSSYVGGNVNELQSPTQSGSLTSLPPRDAWNASAPAMLRVMAALPADPNRADAVMFDGPESSTVFLRPTVSGINQTSNQDVRIGAGRANGLDNFAVSPESVTCSKYLFDNDSYACQATLLMPGGKAVPAGSNVAFLRLASLYRDTSYRVTLYNDASPVKFDGVQPKVDSTGRASNLYRRIESSLNIGDYDSAYNLDAAVTLTGDLCKDFYITNDPATAYGTPDCKTAPRS